MFPARTIAIKATDMNYARLALQHLEQFFPLPPDADAWGLATCVDQRVLLSKNPVLTTAATLSEVTQKLSGECSLLQFRTSTELRPFKHGASANNLGPFRFKNFAAAIIGGPQNPDEANANREFILTRLPKFLSRALEGYSENEALFFFIIAQVHAQGKLEQAASDISAVSSCLGQICKQLPVKSPRSIDFSNSIDICHYSHDSISAVLRIKDAEGLAYNLSHNQRERMKHFRATITFGDLKLGRRKKIALPEWAHFEAMPKNAAYVLSF